MSKAPAAELVVLSVLGFDKSKRSLQNGRRKESLAPREIKVVLNLSLESFERSNSSSNVKPFTDFFEHL